MQSKFKLSNRFLLLFVWIIAQIADASSMQVGDFLVLSDAHLNYTSKHAMDLMPKMQSVLNDLDRSTFYELIKQIHSAIQDGIIKQPKFILYLGDMVGHERTSNNAAFNSEAVFFKTLTKEFSNTPILYTFGNVDSLTADYGPFTSQFKQQSISPLSIARSSAKWPGGFLSTGKVCAPSQNEFPCIVSENTSDGYYSAYIEPHFRIIALNSVMFSIYRKAKDEAAIQRQFTWVEQQLQDAQAKQDSVILTMHIPPGKYVYTDKSLWFWRETARFMQLVNTYKATIVAILAAHTHYNEIKIIQDTSGKHNITAIYLTAALSTDFGNAAAINIFSYANKESGWDLTNNTIFCFFKNSALELKLKKIYDFRASYCNNETETMLHCLQNFSLETLQYNLLVGNKNYFKKILFPADVYIHIPVLPPN